jgi:hypothetical protein
MNVAGTFAAVALAAGTQAKTLPTLAELTGRLARDAALLDAPHERPVHRGAPEPGATGDVLAKHLPPFEDEIRGQHDATGALLPWRLFAQDGDPATLGERERAALSRLGPHLDALLASTRRARAELPSDADAMTPARGATWAGYQLAVEMAGSRALLALQRGDAGAANADCLDALALARDAAISGGLIGSMNARALLDTLVPPCSAVLAVSPPETRRAALRSVRAIRAAIPSVATVFRLEAVQMELMLFGRIAGPELQKHLGPRALAWVDANEPPASATASDPERQRARWAHYREAWEGLLRAAALPTADRERAMEDGRRKLVERFVGDPDTAREAAPFATYAARIDELRTRLDALASGMGRAPATR